MVDDAGRRARGQEDDGPSQLSPQKTPPDLSSPLRPAEWGGMGGGQQRRSRVAALSQPLVHGPRHATPVGSRKRLCGHQRRRQVAHVTAGGHHTVRTRDTQPRRGKASQGRGSHGGTSNTPRVQAGAGTSSTHTRAHATQQHPPRAHAHTHRGWTPRANHKRGEQAPGCVAGHTTNRGGQPPYHTTSQGPGPRVAKAPGRHVGVYTRNGGAPTRGRTDAAVAGVRTSNHVDTGREGSENRSDNNPPPVARARGACEAKECACVKCAGCVCTRRKLATGVRRGCRRPGSERGDGSPRGHTSCGGCWARRQRCWGRGGKVRRMR
jgi:hypothetical protein